MTQPEDQLIQAYHDHKWFMTLYPIRTQDSEALSDLPYIGKNSRNRHKAFIPIRKINWGIRLFREIHGGLSEGHQYEVIMLDEEYVFPDYSRDKSLKAVVFSQSGGLKLAFFSRVPLWDGKRVGRLYNSGPSVSEVMSKVSEPDQKKLIPYPEFF